MELSQDFQAAPADRPARQRFRRVSLADAIGVGSGPRAERTALLVRAYETQHEVLESYYGSWIGVAVALVRDGQRERLEIAVSPEVQLEQTVEELLFRAYTLYRQVDLT